MPFPSVTSTAADLTSAGIQASHALFPPRRADALARLTCFLPQAGSDYRAKRNYDLGPNCHSHVSQLSPYLRNGIVSEDEIVRSVLRKHSFKATEKFLQEVFWRIYWKGYLENRPALWARYRKDLNRLENRLSNDPTYRAATASNTGIGCFDTWSEELRKTGYLHNHARMWFASIWIFTLKLPWQLGAAYFLKHLLDGDPASNTLSWRWVAGLHTKGKTYLARPDNIARFTAERFSDITGLADRADAIEEDPTPAEPIFKNIPLPPSKLLKNQGLLILDEDLRKHIPTLSPGSNVLGLYPSSLYNKKDSSTKVSTFRYACLAETIEGLQSQQGCKTEITSRPNAEQILNWAKRNRLNALTLAQPQVGPWRDLWDTISPQLKSSGIALSYFRPWWENELFPTATSGFFTFRKGIESVAHRMSNQTPITPHASP